MANDKNYGIDKEMERQLLNAIWMPCKARLEKTSGDNDCRSHTVRFITLGDCELKL